MHLKVHDFSANFIMKKYINGKIGLTFLLAFVSTTIFTSCSNMGSKSSLDKNNPVNVTLWHYYSSIQKNILDNAINKFNDTVGKEKGVFIKAENQGSVKDLENKILQLAASNSSEFPDMFTAYSDMGFMMDSQNKLCNLENYITKKEIDTYIDNYIQEGRLGKDNKLKIFPIAKSSEITFLNKTDWDKFKNEINSNEMTSIKISEDDLHTWEGITKVADIYYNWTDNKTPDILNDGKAFFGVDVLANFIIVSNAQLGIDVIKNENDKTSVTIDETAMKKIWDIYYKNMLKGRFAQYGRFRSDDVKTGDLLGFVGANSGVRYFPATIANDDEEHNIELSVMKYPTYEGGKEVSIQQGAGIAVTKSNKSKEEASMLFLKWFTDIDINIDFAIDSGYIPVKKAAYESENISSKLEELKSKEIWDINTAKVLELSIDEVKSSKYYFIKGSENGFNIRRTLEEELNNITNQSLEELNNTKVEDREKVLDKLCSDETFNMWISNLKLRIDSELK